MKKILSAALAAAMVMAMSVSSFATFVPSVEAGTHKCAICGEYNCTKNHGETLPEANDKVSPETGVDNSAEAVLAAVALGVAAVAAVKAKKD